MLYCISALYHDRNTVDWTWWRHKSLLRGAPRLWAPRPGLALGPTSARAGPAAMYANPVSKLHSNKHWQKYTHHKLTVTTASGKSLGRSAYPDIHWSKLSWTGPLRKPFLLTSTTDFWWDRFSTNRFSVTVWNSSVFLNWFPRPKNYRRSCLKARMESCTVQNYQCTWRRYFAATMRPWGARFG